MPTWFGIKMLGVYLTKTNMWWGRLMAGSTALALGATSFMAPMAMAESTNSKINGLKQQAAQNQTAQAGLAAQAETLGATIDSLHKQVTTLESQIKVNKARREQIRLDIAKNETELARQKSILRQNVRTMYMDSDVSTIVMLASSKNLSEYVDKAQYRQTVTTKVNAATQQINNLQKKLQQQKTTVEKMLLDQQAMATQLVAQRAEASRLMNMNRSQQAVYENRIRQINSQMATLRAQQARDNARFVKQDFITGGTGGYPWVNAPFPNTMVDPWGMFQRQCVSYAAWKVDKSGRHMPFWGGRGNANQWDDNARQAGISVDDMPRVGDVAISNSGTYGHAMYVEAINDDGTITISQYNAAWDGRYSMGRITANGLVFIHF